MKKLLHALRGASRVFYVRWLLFPYLNRKGQQREAPEDLALMRKGGVWLIGSPTLHIS